MENLNREQYYNEIRSLAQEAIKECKDSDYDMHDYAYELVDHHAWIIYTHYNYQVLVCSEEYLVIEEMIGDFSSYTTLNDVVQEAAYYAMAQDILIMIEAYQND